MSELETFLGQQLADAERSPEGREKLLQRYLGEKYGDEVAGRSAVLTSEVFDVVETMAAEVMDVLSSTERIVSFTPVAPDDEQRAEDETDACNHVFWQKNAGFEVLETWVKAGLIEQVGYVRSGWAEKAEVEIDEFRDVPAEALTLRVQQYMGDPEIEDFRLLETVGFSVDKKNGLVFEAPAVSFKARIRRKRRAYEIDPIPQDKVRITARWRKQSLQDCPFVAIEDDTRSKSDLLEMGFHPEDVEKLFEADDGERRFETEDNTEADKKGGVTIFEAYAFYDLDDDGIDERIRCWLASEKGQLLRWANGEPAVEEVDSVPVSAWTPILVPHRHAGRSAAEITDDIQRQNTVLMRSLFDSIYATIYPRPVVNEDSASKETWADLASPDHGAPIRVKAADAIQWQKPPSIIGDILPALQRMDSIKEERTGVSKLAQGLDKETLNATASGQQALLNQSQKRLKLVARNMAEYGLKDLFLRMHRDLRKGNIKDIAFKRADAWVQANPTEWPARSEMAVSIGTGNGDRAEKQQTLMLVIQAQRELLTAGSPLVDEVKLHETMERMVKLGGFPSAAPFFYDPRGEEYAQKVQQKAQQPQQPDPAVILAQAEDKKAQAALAAAQAKAMEIQQAGSLEVENMRIAEARAAREHEARMAKLALDTDLARIKLAEADSKAAREDRKVDLAEDKVALDEDFRRDELAVEIVQQDADREMQAQQAERQERQGWLSRWFGQ